MLSFHLVLTLLGTRRQRWLMVILAKRRSLTLGDWFADLEQGWNSDLSAAEKHVLTGGEYKLTSEEEKKEEWLTPHIQSFAVNSTNDHINRVRFEVHPISCFCPLFFLRSSSLWCVFDCLVHPSSTCLVCWSESLVNDLPLLVAEA